MNLKTTRSRLSNQFLVLLAIIIVAVTLLLQHNSNLQLIKPRFRSLALNDNYTSEFLPLCPPLNRSALNGAPASIRPSSACSYCRGKHSSDGRFYDFSTPNFRFFAYSAFYDDRLSLLSSPVIRIIAISDGYARNSKTTLYCILYHSGGTKQVAMEPNLRGSGPGYNFNGRGADPFVHTCPTVGIEPHSLSIVGTGGGHVTSCMPVEYPVKPKLQRDFVVCVPVSYGNMNPYRIIEWMEMQKILGVNLVRVYDLYLHEPALKVLRHYEKEGFVQVRKMDRVYPHEYHLHILELAISLNDCLYRHMYEFKRMITNDFDEFIKPLKHDNLQQLVGYLERTVSSNKSANYVFRNTYFFLEVPPDANMSTRFTILRYRKKAVVSEMWHRVKPITLTMACIHVYSHVCVDATANYTNRGPMESISPEIAVVQHYRRCPYGGADCERTMKDMQQDDSVLAYRDRITAAFRENVKAIMGNVTIDF